MVNRYFTEKENTKWLKDLPKKSVAVKVIITSKQGNVLLVRPNYKPSWQLPGGGVEPLEDPKGAALREVQEELGLSLENDSLRLLDTVFRQEHDNLILIYEYVLPVAEGSVLNIQESELEGYKFEAAGEIPSQISGYYAAFWDRYVHNDYAMGAKKVS